MSDVLEHRQRRTLAPAPRTVALAVVADVALVTLFASIGRSSHDRTASVSGLLETAWPFIAGLGIAWLAIRAFRRPLSIMRSGLPLWIGAVAIGMLLRAATGAGTAVSFVVVTAVTLGVFLIGWRAIAVLVIRLRSR